VVQPAAALGAADDTAARFGRPGLGRALRARAVGLRAGTVGLRVRVDPVGNWRDGTRRSGRLLRAA
jgi:hypothetical protein